MVKMYPEELPNRVRRELGRSAEIKMYDALRDQLGENWVVFYSVAWLGRRRTDDTPRDGETDFIVAHPEYGVLLIEVKGGIISYVGSQRQWITTNRGGFDKMIDPFTQVVENKYALLRKIRSLPGWSNTWVKLGHAIAFPDCAVSRTLQVPEAAAEIIIDGDDLAEGIAASRMLLPPEAAVDIIIDGDDLADLAERIVAIMSYWKGEEAEPSPCGAVLVTELERLLAPTTTLPNPLRIQVKDEEQEFLRLTEEQFRMLGLLSRMRRAAISGCAGSGKTTLAVEKAKRLAHEGFRTLLTCYNNSLATYLAEAVGKVENLFICTFHQLCSKMAREAGIELPSPEGSDQQKVFDEDYPDALSDAVRLRPKLKYDAIIIDEGQDFQDRWWLALEDCLLEGCNSIFYVFYDDNQRLYQDRGNIPSDLQRYPLMENVRNTRTIHRAVAMYYQGEFPSMHRGPVGRSVEVHHYETSEEVRKLLRRVVYKLASVEQIGYRDLVVLGPRSLNRSALRELSVEESRPRLVEEYSGGGREMLYSTIYSFKGLERPVVIVVELDEDFVAVEETRDALCYVAFSRPRNHLVLLGQQRAILGLLPQGK